MKSYAIILILVSILSFAAAEELPITEYGLKVGLVSANQDFNYEYEFDMESEFIMGGCLGLYYEWFEIKGFRLLTELNWVQKGMKDSIMEIDSVGNFLGEEEYTHRLNYLSVPVLVKLFLENDILTPFLNLGIRFDFLMSYNSEIYTSLYDEFSGYVIGADLGIGFQKKLIKDRNLSLEIRYSMDLTDSYSGDYLTIKNSATQIIFGIQL